MLSKFKYILNWVQTLSKHKMENLGPILSEYFIYKNLNSISKKLIITV